MTTQIVPKSIQDSWLSIREKDDIDNIVTNSLPRSLIWRCITKGEYKRIEVYEAIASYYNNKQVEINNRLNNIS